MKRILIFDDDADILEILTYLLNEKGWDVHTRANCNDILSIVEECRPDVILMDNWIPDAGGIIATRTVKSSDELRDIPVIYFSANNDIEKLAAEAGADAWLAKPFDLDELEQLLSRFR
ncbi:response regulator [Pararcticibacter amylolyticus]|uniref:Response regulator n=1 Tax=Pararcticibacter amylolyticus TaxID=2173175 RepID=A0A2U2PDU6_9SPHI|nr:response regulator [Pararcticibacter amylolyticus]PWG79484.1 response regulator [Pararcticibacter amylolyticus]